MRDLNVIGVGSRLGQGLGSRSRSIALAVVGCSALLVALNFPSLSEAQSKNETAEQLNAEGKALIEELNLEGAAAKFREAIRLVEDPRYAFNLCYTLEKSGGLEEAKRACQWVTGSTNPRLAKKAAVLLKKVEAKLKVREKEKPPEPKDPSSPTGETPVSPPASPPASPPNGYPPGTPPSEFPTSPPPTGPPASSTGITASTSGQGYPPPGVRTPPIAPLPMPSAEPKTNRWGLRIGATNSFADNLGNSDGGLFSGVVGAMYTRSFTSSFQVIFESQLARRGTELEEGGFFADDEVDLLLSYLDISSTSRFSLGQGRLKPFLEIGSSLSFLLLSDRTGKGESVADPEVPLFDFSLNFGGGLLVGSFELRVLHMRGLLDLSGGELMSGPAHSRSTQFEIGYWF